MTYPETLIGEMRRFGPVGPLYEVIGTGDALPDGDRMMTVRLLESGEVATYRLTHLLHDPAEDQCSRSPST